MAGTLRPDPEFQRFNLAKENLGNYFRFKPRSAVFNVVFMGLVPLGLTIAAYNLEGQVGFFRKFRKEKILGGDDYVPRDKDL
ncbi:predicted protein [Scheffersomyces stipitis CBS 6054]|uniref:Complex I-B15 n=1 Tax=Scheffersomyces stipitis (strain ATCC 58785 / CBS 6054 / NBRC 10063 / NRRL Y-11545) TaxID=322104 RepID=A3LU71_PICST|nr:predicted protein [Scheffersomyces stipitis CBS 6054]ABN66192.1 predicted protein [Scheffersomyces stipitis CBS 6054]KAG2733288.1 hypothetical protein G9P44_004278 [Scheffersomyces stipitis]